MSIVISVIEKNEKLYIASDKRGKRRGIIDNSYQKIYQLSKNLYFGMTGIYEAGLMVLDYIKTCDVNNIDNLIEKTNNFFNSSFRTDKPEKLAIIVAGRYNSGNFFIWSKTVQGETKFIKGSNNIEFTVSSNKNIKYFSRCLEEQIEKKIRLGTGIKDAIIETIEYASKIDSSISKEYELYEITAVRLNKK